MYCFRERESFSSSLLTKNRLTIIYLESFLAYELFKNVSIRGYLLLAYLVIADQVSTWILKWFYYCIIEFISTLGNLLIRIDSTIYI